MSTSPSYMLEYSLNGQNELCLAIKQILINADSYSNADPTNTDMDTVRQEFRGNGHCELDEAKENKKPWTGEQPPSPASAQAAVPLALSSYSSSGSGSSLSTANYTSCSDDSSSAGDLSMEPVDPASAVKTKPLRAKLTAASASGVTHCVFCQNNQQPVSVYKSHVLRDEYGRTQCPLLRIYTCPRCGANGDNAHTLRYCTKKRIVTMEEALSNTSTSSKGFKYRRGVRM